MLKVELKALRALYKANLVGCFSLLGVHTFSDVRKRKKYLCKSLKRFMFL